MTDRTDYTTWSFQGIAIPDYMMHGLLDYRDRHHRPGDFLYRVLCNDLIGAVGQADDTNRYCIPAYAGFMNNEMNPDSYGSQEIVDAWIDAKPEPAPEHADARLGIDSCPRLNSQHEAYVGDELYAAIMELVGTIPTPEQIEKSMAGRSEGYPADGGCFIENVNDDGEIDPDGPYEIEFYVENFDYIELG